MKKIVLVLGLISLLVGPVSAVDLAPLQYQFPVMGTPVDNTFRATLDNTTVRSIQSLAEAAGITWMQNGQTPHGIWISVETQNARFGTTGVVASDNASLVVGHVLVKDTVPIHFSGAGFINALKLGNAVSTSNAVVQITLER